MISLNFHRLCTKINPINAWARIKLREKNSPQTNYYYWLTPNVHFHIVFAESLKVCFIDDKQSASNHWCTYRRRGILLTFDTFIGTQVFPFENLRTKNDIVKNMHKYISTAVPLVECVGISIYRFFFSILLLRSLTKFQSKPPRRSAEAPIYWNVSILMTSMTGHTTRVGSSATRSSSGSNHISLHSQWLSRNVSTSAMAASAPRTLERTKPSRFSLRITLTLFILANSKPSSAIFYANEN